MRIILSESVNEAAWKVAEIMVERIETRPSSVLGLATGNTMIPVYEAWVRLAQKHRVDHSKAFLFMLDEYLGLPADHPSSFEHYITEHLMKPLGIRRDQFALPQSEAADLYEKTIKESGGIDIQLLGIGTNGHIGFNEPGSGKDSRTRKVTLAETTRINNSKGFMGTMPTEAVSMGIGTILESKSIIMLATGKSKADVVKYILNHHDDLECPATFLKTHPHFTLILDPEAASKVNLKI